ncbi:hypothetical protein QCA50_019255 [Cerrena zonata]|uniref:N-acetyltransferase domain-containing protein n=1 Tax=Cerrena zonata TaxID=2478898 RepID=A0AAW0FJB8_9APHY
MLTTDRLILRAYRESEMEEISEFSNTYKVQLTTNPFFVAPTTPKSKDGLKGAFDISTFNAIIALKEDPDKPLGFVIVSIRSREVKNRNGLLGICIREGYWDKGYGTEAMSFVVDYSFRALAMHRLSLEVYDINGRAIAVYERVGFVKEAVKRKNNWIEGKWRDTILMGITEDEWKGRVQKASE